MPIYFVELVVRARFTRWQHMLRGKTIVSKMKLFLCRQISIYVWISEKLLLRVISWETDYLKREEIFERNAIDTWFFNDHRFSISISQERPIQMENETEISQVKQSQENYTT